MLMRFMVVAWVVLTLGCPVARADAQSDYRRCPSILTPELLRGAPNAAVDVGRQYCLGLVLFRGTSSIPRDPVRACRWHALAAQRGHAGAQAAYGYCLESGAGGKTDPAGALSWYRRSADQGDADAMLAIAAAYQAGRVVARDEAEATRWARRAADAGSERARTFLRRRGEYQAQSGTRDITQRAYAALQAKNYAQARALYQRAADAGDPSAQVALGTLLRLGQGGPADATAAMRWYRKAADAGYARAQAQLGFAYEYGEGAAADWREAARWCARAAQQAERLGLYCAGRQYQFGIGVPQDRQRAVALFERAADQGDQSAAFFARWLSDPARCTGYRDEAERNRFLGVCVNPRRAFATPAERNAWLAREFDAMNREALRNWAASASGYADGACRAAGGNPSDGGCRGDGGVYFNPASQDRFGRSLW